MAQICGTRTTVAGWRSPMQKIANPYFFAVQRAHDALGHPIFKATEPALRTRLPRNAAACDGARRRRTAQSYLGGSVPRALRQFPTDHGNKCPIRLYELQRPEECHVELAGLWKVGLIVARIALFVSIRERCRK